MTALTLATACKVNLHLEIIGRRPDGFHELRTIFQTVDLGDRLELEESSGLSLEVTGDGAVPADASNLVVRAAEALAAKVGQRPGAAMRLHKRVPAGAGLGGGSADAAAALLGLRQLWGLRLGDDELHGIAAALGSDIPFFLIGGTAIAGGRGERLQPLPDRPSESILIVRPPGELSAAEVYAALSAPPLTSNGPLSTIDLLAFDQSSISFRNDLEETVFTLRPELRALRDELHERGAASAMVSGSGVCLYGRFPDGLPEGFDEGWPRGIELVATRFRSRRDYFRGLAVGSASKT